MPDDRLTKAEWQALLDQQSQQKRIATMDAETSKQWNAWFDDRFLRLFADEIAEMLGEESGKNEHRLREQLRKEFTGEVANVEKKFAAKMSKLRADMCLKSGIATGKITQLPELLKYKG